ncbi:MAG: helix-turn-helix transcriptional regulator [Micromonosporaceae bacterium]
MWHRVLLDEPGLRVAEVRCGGGAGWSELESVTSHALVLARQGVFRRRVDGKESLVDPVTGYLQVPGGEQQIAHPAGGDVCTSIRLDPGSCPPPRDSRLLVRPAADLAHRRLIAGVAGSSDPVRLADLASALVAALLVDLVAVGADRRGHRLVNQVREALYHDPNARLTALSRRLVVSPYHLSRVFHRVTGVPLAGYRGQLRARRAMDLLARGDASIGHVAATLGYADQAHLTRALRAQTGATPRQLRRLLHQG